MSGRLVNFTDTILTPGNVGQQGIAIKYQVAIEGDARGCEAQPLIVSNLTFPDGRVHNVLYLATMYNQVWARDADTGELLWAKKFDVPIAGSQAIDMYQINSNWGIISTPVIDLTNNMLYFVTWGIPDAQAGDGVYLLHEVDLITGDEPADPISLEGATYTAPNGKVSTFKSVTRKQRASLLLSNDGQTLFIGAGSLLESLDTNQGWVLAVSLSLWKITAAWTTTSKGSGGGIWMSGAPLVQDYNDYIYFATGNGDFDGVNDFGQCVVALEYNGMSLKPYQWWSPFLDDDRTGDKNVDDENAVVTISPSNTRATAMAAQAGTLVETMASGEWGDQDLGAGGVTLMEPLGIVGVAGKDGILYPCKLGSLGNTTPETIETAENYSKLAFPPVFFTYYQTGTPTPVGATALCQNLNVLWGNVTHHQHGEFIYWNRPTLGDRVFCWGENGNLRVWSISKTGIHYLAASAEMSSPDCQGTPGGGMPGGMITLSSNGELDGLIIASVPYGDANMTITNGRLLVYDAQNYVNGQMKVLWDSQDWGITYMHNKFNRVAVANGKLYVPTYDARVLVFGLT